FLMLGAAGASAAPNWGIQVRWAPQHIAPGSEGEFYIRARNYGPTAAESSVVVRDRLPANLEVTAIRETPEAWECGGEGTREVECRIPSKLFEEFFPPELLKPLIESATPPPGNKQGENGFFNGRLTVDVKAASNASGTETNVAEIEGGGA